jgi:hypothetical protein
MISRKRISRRTVLRGVGATVALPWLEQMNAAPTAPLRSLFVYIPNGVILRSWTPKQTGAQFELPPSLKSVEAVRRHVTIVSHLDRTYVSGTGVHAQCGSCWLTSSPPSEALDGGFPTNISLDQILAQKLGEHTAFPSLELSCNNHTDNKETRYFESISWLAPGYAASVEKDPRAVFERLFGSKASDALAGSVLDIVNEQAKSLRSRLGAPDQVKLDEYLHSVRSVERRIQFAETATATRVKPALAPPSMPEDRGAYIRLMMELIVLAFQQDLTRVATLVIDPERWDSPRTYHGVLEKPEDHHQLTHTKGEEALEKLVKIDSFHVKQFAHLVERMSSIREGERTMLDTSSVVMGSGLGDGSVHSYKDLGLLYAGSAGGRLKTGEHVALPGGTPLANLWLTLLQVNNVERPRFADSTGVLRQVLS